MVGDEEIALVFIKFFSSRHRETCHCVLDDCRNEEAGSNLMLEFIIAVDIHHGVFNGLGHSGYSGKVSAADHVDKGSYEFLSG